MNMTGFIHILKMLRNKTDCRAAARCLVLAIGVVPLSVATLCAATVQETTVEFYATGDFNGDGQTDLALVDRDTGRVRIGYRISEEFFNWSDWRPSGVRSVTGVSVGRVFTTERDALLLTSADANLIAALDAPDPSVPMDPTEIFSEVLGPSTIVAADIGGAGNTPLHDIYIASIYNDDPENLLSLYRADGGEFTPLAELAAKGAATRGQRLALVPGGAEFVTTIIATPDGNVFRADSLASGKPAEVLAISNVPDNADVLVGDFAGAVGRQVIFFPRGAAEFVSSRITAEGDKFKGSALQTVTLPQEYRQLATVTVAGQSRLIALGSTNEPAQLLDFDGVSTVTPGPTLAATTNYALITVATLPDTVILLSGANPDKPPTYYQVYVWRDGKFTVGAFGNIAGPR
jgi:hypothetical protein